MGGAAGHLSHLQENTDFTFGEIKSILQDVATTDMEVIEKVDGQNLFFTWDAATGQLRTARSAGDIKRGGMSPAEFAGKWKGHPAEDAFTQGFAAIQRGMDQLGPEQLLELFGPDGRNYVNAEIMYVDNPNLIIYAGNYIVLHNLHQFPDPESDDGVEVTSRGPFQALVSAIETAEAKLDAEGWAISGPQIIELRNIMEGDHYQRLSQALSDLAPDDATLGDFAAEKLRVGPIGNLPIPVNEQEGLINLMLGRPNAISLRQLKKGKPKDVQKLISAMGTKANSRKAVSAMLAPVERAISDFAIEVLRGMESFFVDDHDSEIKRQRAELESSIQKIQSVQGADAEKLGNMLDRQLEKLGDIENIASTMEGIVFEFPPGSEHLYKLTGSFAMTNQIVGRAKRLPTAQAESLLRNYIKMIILAD